MLFVCVQGSGSGQYGGSSSSAYRVTSDPDVHHMFVFRGLDLDLDQASLEAVVKGLLLIQMFIICNFRVVCVQGSGSGQH